MNYERIYEQFIDDRRRREGSLTTANRSDWQRHHIKPKSTGGSDRRENLINLTHADHLFAHVLLAKIYGGALWSTVLLMLGAYPVGRRARACYAAARRNYAEHQSKKLTGQPGFFSGRKHSVETRAKLSESHTGLIQSEETRRKRSELSKGNKYRVGKRDDEETRQRKRIRMLGNASRTGQTRGEEERRRCSESVRLSWTPERHEQHQAMLARRWGKT
jgi:hypothetical protein